jgi:hypothetical protein
VDELQERRVLAVVRRLHVSILVESRAGGDEVTDVVETDLQEPLFAFAVVHEVFPLNDGTYVSDFPACVRLISLTIPLNFCMVCFPSSFKRNEGLNPRILAMMTVPS